MHGEIEVDVVEVPHPLKKSFSLMQKPCKITSKHFGRQEHRRMENGDSCLEIIKCESLAGWKFCFQAHDSVYVIGTPEQAPEIAAILEQKAVDALNFPLLVETEIYGRDAICKSE